MNKSKWNKVYRSLDEAEKRLIDASTEEQFQAIGVLCRETLISLAQTVYDPDKHLINVSVVPSKTDAKRMLDAYLSHFLQGSTNEKIRRHVKTTIDLTNELQHKRTADHKSAALCIEATTAAVKMISLVSENSQGINPPELSVRISYRGPIISHDEHVYLLKVIISNTGGRSIKEYKLEFTFPNLDSIPLKWHTPKEKQQEGKLLEIKPQSNSVIITEDRHLVKVSYLSKNMIFPEEINDLSEIIGMKYRINYHIFANRDNIPPLKWTLYSDDLKPKYGEIHILQLNEY